jgi:hypothetical protein
MDEDKFAFLNDEPEAEPEQPAPEQPAEAEAKPEGKGEEPAASPAASSEPQPGPVPLVALLEERERRQRAEREAEELRRWRQEMEARQQQPAPPDPLDDPQGAMAYQQRLMQAQLQHTTLKQSRFFAEREFGKEAVEEALAYFDQNPQESHRFMAEPSPFHAAVEHVKRQKLVAEIGADPEAWRKQQAEALRAEIRAELEAELSRKGKPAAPPRSLASAPSAGGNSEATPDPFEEMFGLTPKG